MQKDLWNTKYVLQLGFEESTTFGRWFALCTLWPSDDALEVVHSMNI